MNETQQADAIDQMRRIARLEARIEELKQTADNGAECSKCLREAAEPVCMYCAECYGGLVTRIDELEAALPKCNRLVDGRLLCNKPVTPGMILYVIDPEWSDDDEPTELTVKGLEGSHVLVDNAYGEREAIDPSICYDSREAAEAARET